MSRPPCFSIPLMPLPTVAAFFGDIRQIDHVYGPEEKRELHASCRFPLPPVTLENFDAHRDGLGEIEVIFSTWGMPRLEAAHLVRMPSLRAVFFAAGSVKHFAGPLLDRGISVISAWKVNAIPTAEFAFAQILLSLKGAFRNRREFRSPEAMSRAFRGPGGYEESVALLGVGAVGRHVVRLLRQTDVRVLACDPWLPPAEAETLGVEPVSLEEAFARAFVVSCHMPLLPETAGLLTTRLFERMRPDATFINTARGGIVDEPGLISVLARRPDLQALLDVTDPEPPAEGSPLFSLPNVFLTAHLAGAVNHETRRLGRACVSEFLAWKNGRPLAFAVPVEKVACMA